MNSDSYNKVNMLGGPREAVSNHNVIPLTWDFYCKRNLD